MRRAFGLVEFAFALQFFIAGDFASRVFNSAFRLFSDAFSRVRGPLEFLFVRVPGLTKTVSKGSTFLVRQTALV